MPLRGPRLLTTDHSQWHPPWERLPWRCLRFSSSPMCSSSWTWLWGSTSTPEVLPSYGTDGSRFRRERHGVRRSTSCCLEARVDLASAVFFLVRGDRHGVSLLLVGAGECRFLFWFTLFPIGKQSSRWSVGRARGTVCMTTQAVPWLSEVTYLEEIHGQQLLVIEGSGVAGTVRFHCSGHPLDVERPRPKQQQQ